MTFARRDAHAPAPIRARHGLTSAALLEKQKILVMQPGLAALASIVSPGSTSATMYPDWKANRAWLATAVPRVSIARLEHKSAGSQVHMAIIAIGLDHALLDIGALMRFLLGIINNVFPIALVLSRMWWNK